MITWFLVNEAFAGRASSARGRGLTGQTQHPARSGPGGQFLCQRPRGLNDDKAPVLGGVSAEKTVLLGPPHSRCCCYYYYYCYYYHYELQVYSTRVGVYVIYRAIRRLLRGTVPGSHSATGSVPRAVPSLAVTAPSCSSTPSPFPPRAPAPLAATRSRSVSAGPFAFCLFVSSVS